MKVVNWCLANSHSNIFATIMAAFIYVITYPYFYITREK
jgi:hypothetical protein